MEQLHGQMNKFGTQAILLLLLLTCVFPGTFLHGEFIVPGDLLFPQRPWEAHAPENFTAPQNPLMPDIVTAFLPYYSATNFALQANEWPLWNPYEFGGMPLMANCQSAIFYPPRILHYLFGIGLGQTLYILLKLWLCGMIAYTCAAPLGLRPGWDRLFSILWMLASYNIIWSNWSLPDVSIWAPLLMAGIELILAERYRRGFFSVILAGSGLLLAGHPETAFMMALGIGTYFMLRILFERIKDQRLPKMIGVCLGAWAIALLVTAPQWLPFIEYLTNSYTFFERATHAKDDYFTLGAITQFWLPHFYGSSYNRNFWGQLDSNVLGMLYTSLIAWAGLVLLLSLRKEEPRLFRRAMAAILAMSIGIGAAFGLPALDWIHTLPIFSSALKPYHIVFTILVLPLFGTLGLQAWCTKPRPLWTLWPCILLLLSVIALMYQAYSFNEGLILRLNMLDFLKREFIIGLSIAAAILLILSLQKRLPTRIGIALLILIAAGDLLHANRGLNVTLPKEQLYPETTLTTALQELKHPTRIGLGEAYIPSGIMVPYGIEGFLAYDGLYPESMMRFQITMGEDIWESMEPVCAKAYYLHRPDAPFQFPADEQPKRFKLIADYDGLSLYKNKAAFPRAFLAGELEIIPEQSTLFNRMRSPDYDPGALVLTMPTKTLTTVPQSLKKPQANVGTATIESYRSTEVLLTIDANQESVLILADTYMPGWHVTIDNQPATIFPAYYAFRGVIVPQGTHTLRFTYWPTTLTIGLILSLIGMILSMGIAWATRPKAS